MKKQKFISEIEKLIDPISVGTLHFMQGFSEGLPGNIQSEIVHKSSKKNPYMGFVVDPYCTFLYYEMTDKEYYQKMLPTGFELMKTKIFETDEQAKDYLIIASFNVRTSAFMGSRSEIYVMARNKDTNLCSWIILDYLSNTISFEPKYGLTKPEVKGNFVTTDYEGNLIVKMRSDQACLDYEVDLTNGQNKKLSYEMWMEANFSIAYSNKLSDSNSAFSLKFMSGEMDQALEIDKEMVRVNEMDWLLAGTSQNIDRVVCFAYAQHFLSDSPGFESKILSQSELEANVDSLEFNNIIVYSNEKFKKFILLTPLILMIIIVIEFIIILNT